MEDQPISNIRAIFITIFVSIVIFTLGFNTTSLFDMAVPMSRQLHLSPSETQWLINSYMLTVAVLIMGGGKLCDFITRRFIFLTGCILLIISSLVVALSYDVVMLYIGRVAQGVSCALVLPASIALIKLIVPEKLQITAFGIWSAILGVGFASGPTIGGALTDVISWRAGFYLIALLAFIGGIVSWVLIPKMKLERLEKFRFDWVGIVLWILGFGSLIIGLMEAQDWGWNSPITYIVIGAGIILLIAFMVTELLVKYPLMRPHVFVNLQLMAAIVGYLCYGFVITTLLSYLLLFLQDPLLQHDSAMIAGASLLPFSIAVFLFSITIEYIRKVIKSVRLLLDISFAFIISGFAILCFIHTPSSYWFLFIPLLLVGIGFGMLQASLPKFAAESVTPDRMGEATGLTWTSVYLAAVISILVLGVVYLHTWEGTFTHQLASTTEPTTHLMRWAKNLQAHTYNITQLLHRIPRNIIADVSAAYKAASIKSMRLVMIISTGTLIVFWLMFIALNICGYRKKCKTSAANA